MVAATTYTKCEARIQQWQYAMTLLLLKEARNYAGTTEFVF